MRKPRRDIEYDQAPTRAVEHAPDARPYKTRAAPDETLPSERHRDHLGSGGASYDPYEKTADYAAYREQDRLANASNVQGEFAGRLHAPSSDDEILQNVIEIVAANPDIDPERLRVKVDDGDVTLSGAVPAPSVRDWIDHAIEAVPGVRHICDELEIEERSPERHALR